MLNRDSGIIFTLNSKTGSCTTRMARHKVEALILPNGNLRLNFTRIQSDFEAKYRTKTKTRDNELITRRADIKNLLSDVRTVGDRLMNSDDSGDEDELLLEQGVFYALIRNHNKRIQELEAVTELSVKCEVITTSGSIDLVVGHLTYLKAVDKPVVA